MLDPYLVLGVGKYDDDQTVKKAYRSLSKQYHPDNNLNNPNKDAAEETFKKIQQAYEQIMHERSLGIGGPDDLRRNRDGGSESNSNGAWDSVRRASWNHGDSYSDNGSSQSGNTSWGNGSSGNNGYSYGGFYQNGSTGNSSSQQGSSWKTGTKERERANYSSGFWNNAGSAFNSNADAGNSRDYDGTNEYDRSSGSTGYYSGNPYGNSYGQSENSNGSYGYYSGNYSYSGNQGYGSAYGYDNNMDEDTDSRLSEIAGKLNARDFFGAWDMLNSMQNRNDVWYYYSAIANMGLGNSITALSHARKAKELQPGRVEYDELINGIQSGAIQYRGRSDMFAPQKGNAGNTCLKIGLAMIFMNIFCGGGGAVCSSTLCIGC